MVKSELDLYKTPKLLSCFFYYYSGFSELLNETFGNIFTPYTGGTGTGKWDSCLDVTQPKRASQQSCLTAEAGSPMCPKGFLDRGGGGSRGNELTRAKVFEAS